MHQAFVVTAAAIVLSVSSAQGQSSGNAPSFSDPEAQVLSLADPVTYKDSQPYGIQQSPIANEDVLWRKRVWRIVDAADIPNSLLKTVSEKGLMAMLITAVQSGQVKAYSNADDRFTHAIAPDVANALAESDTQITTRYLLKEDWVYLSGGRGLIGRTIGIAPLASGTAEDIAAAQPLFWIYYPELRPFLRMQAVEKDGVQNLDEWFEERHYSSTITKVSDLHSPTAVYRKK